MHRYLFIFIFGLRYCILILNIATVFLQYSIIPIYEEENLIIMIGSINMSIDHCDILHFYHYIGFTCLKQMFHTENQAPSAVKIKQTVQVPVTSDVSPSDHESLQQQGTAYVASKIGCLEQGTCSVNVDTGTDSRRRRRRQTDAEDDDGLDMTITITMETGGGSIDNSTGKL